MMWYDWVIQNRLLILIGAVAASSISFTIGNLIRGPKQETDDPHQAYLKRHPDLCPFLGTEGCQDYSNPLCRSLKHKDCVKGVEIMTVLCAELRREPE